MGTSAREATFRTSPVVLDHIPAASLHPVGWRSHLAVFALNVQYLFIPVILLVGLGSFYSGRYPRRSPPG